MMCAFILFGLRLMPLYKAIATVESGRGAMSSNIYQIREVYVNDVNRIYGLVGKAAYKTRDVYDADKAEMMMYLYWKHWAYQYAKRTRNPVTFEVLARIHNGGPMGAERDYTIAYWSRVNRELKKLEEAEHGKTPVQ